LIDRPTSQLAITQSATNKQQKSKQTSKKKQTNTNKQTNNKKLDMVFFTTSGPCGHVPV